MSNDTALVIRRLWFRNGKILLTELGLLALSVGAAFAPLNGYNTAVSVVIAAIMATLGLLFFMNLVRESVLLKLAASGGFFWLIILFTLTLSDYFTRTS
jgi:cytochrome c oxidase subunit 4